MRQRLLSMLVLVLATKVRAGAAPQVSVYPNPTAGTTTSEVMLAIVSPVRIALFSLPARKWQICR